MISADITNVPVAMIYIFLKNKANPFCLTKVIIINISLALILCVNSWSQTKTK